MTIEQRAKQVYSVDDGIEGSFFAQDDIDRAQDLQMAYIKGATDQRAIEIEKACEWMKAELYDESTIDFRHPTDISSRSYWTVEELVNAFRNAMNNFR